MSSVKIIAILAVIVVVAGGAGAFVLLNNGNSKTVERVDTALAVYGNANNDTDIDNKDSTLIQEIIDGKKDAKEAKKRVSGMSGGGPKS